MMSNTAAAHSGPRFSRRSPFAVFRSLMLMAMLAAPVMMPAVLPSPARADDPDEAVKVFNSMKPSVVSIYNSEGSGTGVLLNTDGLILTCAHVVTSPIPYEVKVDLGTPDEPKVTIFKKVQIVGYHPERDLALIKIDPKENNATLVAATVSKDKASTGQRIYAIGDPGAGDKVLEKTITQGIISGVDRDFDQQKFYQIDAAVNPGNSGGPVVDHSGKVLGIVTFQFNKLQALNFAIPLRDIDFTKFVPLTDHKANPARSAELLQQAKAFTEAAQEVYRSEGADSDNYKKLAYYAAYCYSEALIYDPSNPEIYTDIGMQYITLDMDESASAYLVRAVELRPWGTNTALTYHALGVAWNKQKMQDKALTAWNEGLAKFPYSAMLWDDTAVYHIEKEEYADAAYASAVALACGGRKARIASLQRMLRDAKGHLDDNESSDLTKKTDHDALCAALDKMRVKSNKARKRRSLYMTTPFVDLMKEVGTLDVPGVEDKISQVPLRAPEALAIGEDVADADADPDATPKKKKKAAAVAPADQDDSGDDSGGDVKPKKKKAAADDSGDDDSGADKPKKKASSGDEDNGNGDDGSDATPPKKKHKILTPPDDDPSDVPEVPPHKKAKPGDSDGSDGSDDEPKNKAKPADGKGGDDWIGGKKGDKGSDKGSDKPGDAAPVAPSTVIAPVPAVTGLDLAGPVGTVDDAKVVPVDVDNQEISDAVFSADGTFAYVLQKTGLLRKIAIPTLKEERQINLASGVTGLGMTKKGLAVYVSTAGEVWLLDPKTLEVKHRVAVPGVVRMSTAVSSSQLLVSTGPKDLELIDPVGEKIVAKFTPAELTGGTGPAVTFGLFSLTPDGKTLFCFGSESLCEYSVSEGTITFVSNSPKLGIDPQKIVISPDSKYVAMPCKSGNENIAGEPKKEFATYVFKVADLQKPVMTIESGLSPKELAFDVPAKQIYAQNNLKQLMVFSPGGDKLKDYILSKDKNPDQIKFLVHPSGHSLLVLAGGALQWVTLP